ncbi:hypothetical protein ABZ208_12555 [Streptomyces sp. NPDC006208]|uniref:hypothetical protein n=1 Tax=Streptomyces sp. NPDC006208 TaxID=3156734 RepID=UPI0033A08C38
MSTGERDAVVIGETMQGLLDRLGGQDQCALTVIDRPQPGRLPRSAASLMKHRTWTPANVMRCIRANPARAAAPQPERQRRPYGARPGINQVTTEVITAESRGDRNIKSGPATPVSREHSASWQSAR